MPPVALKALPLSTRLSPKIFIPSILCAKTGSGIKQDNNKPSFRIESRFSIVVTDFPRDRFRLSLDRLYHLDYMNVIVKLAECIKPSAIILTKLFGTATSDMSIDSSSQILPTS